MTALEAFYVELCLRTFPITDRRESRSLTDKLSAIGCIGGAMLRRYGYAKEQEFNHLGVFRRGAQPCAPTYEQFVGFI